MHESVPGDRGCFRTRHKHVTCPSQSLVPSQCKVLVDQVHLMTVQWRSCGVGINDIIGERN